MRHEAQAPLAACRPHNAAHVRQEQPAWDGATSTTATTHASSLIPRVSGQKRPASTSNAPTKAARLPAHNRPPKPAALTRVPPRLAPLTLPTAPTVLTSPEMRPRRAKELASTMRASDAVRN